MVVEEKETSNLFMASSFLDAPSSSVQLVDSGCSNHIMGDRSLFVSLDEAQKISVRLGNDKEMLVDGVGTVCIQLQGVQLVPGLAHNLLSEGN